MVSHSLTYHSISYYNTICKLTTYDTAYYTMINYNMINYQISWAGFSDIFRSDSAWKWNLHVRNPKARDNVKQGWWPLEKRGFGARRAKAGWLTKRAVLSTIPGRVVNHYTKSFEPLRCMYIYISIDSSVYLSAGRLLGLCIHLYIDWALARPICICICIYIYMHDYWLGARLAYIRIHLHIHIHTYTYISCVYIYNYIGWAFARPMHICIYM